MSWEAGLSCLPVLAQVLRFALDLSVSLDTPSRTLCSPESERAKRLSFFVPTAEELWTHVLYLARL